MSVHEALIDSLNLNFTLKNIWKYIIKIISEKTIEILNENILKNIRLCSEPIKTSAKISYGTLWALKHALV